MIKTKGDPMTTLEAANVTERVIREQFGYWRVRRRSRRRGPRPEPIM